MINIQFDPKGKEKAVQAAKKGWAYGKQGGLCVEIPSVVYSISGEY